MKVKTLVSLLLLIFVMCSFYMGQYYKSLGDIAGSIFLTLIVAALMTGLSWVATAARQREGSFSETLHIVGIVIGVVYIIVGTCFVVPEASHFFYVNSETKNIQVDVDTVLSQTDKMFTEYESSANDRVLFLINKIKDSQKSESGQENFKKAYPGKTYDNTFVSTEGQTFKNQLYRHFKPNKEKWKTIKEECRQYIVEDWNIFSSPLNVKILDESVKNYSTVLKDDYEKLKSPYERLYGEKIAFDTEVSADNIVDKIKGTDTNGVWNIILFVLVIISGSSFIFVQGTHIKKQKKNDPIYEQGYDL